MNERILEISDIHAYLSIDRGFIKVTLDDGKEYKVPIDDVGGVVANSHSLTYSNQFLVKLSEKNIPLIVCGKNYTPIGVLWSLDTHTHQSGRLDNQINCRKSLYNKSWQDIIKTKIYNQSICLKALNKNSIKVESCISKVLSADKSHQESISAKVYYKELFGKDFVRDRDSQGLNSFLNYGYTILRSGMSRAIMGAGLHPGIGIFHRNKYNSMRLSDDFMEPFRPIVDYFAYKLFFEYGEQELTPKIKHILVQILYLDMDSPRGRSPVFIRMQNLATSFAISLEHSKVMLDLPVLSIKDLLINDKF